MADDEEVEEDLDVLSIVSVFGGNRRGGRWRMPEVTSITALFGKTFLDLREVESQAKEIRISCLSVFAGVIIVVPEGADVRPAGSAILASSSCHIPVTEMTSSLPPIVVTATTVLGKLRIQTVVDEPKPRKKRFTRKPKAVSPAMQAFLAATATATETATSAEAPAPSVAGPTVDASTMDAGVQPTLAPTAKAAELQPVS